MNYDGHEALRRDMAGLANNLCDLKTQLCLSLTGVSHEINESVYGHAFADRTSSVG